jgi:hypothetical protein
MAATVAAYSRPNSFEDSSAPGRRRSNLSSGHQLLLWNQGAAVAMAPYAGCRLSGGGVESDPGLVGQLGDPFGPQHGREGEEHAWQALGRHNRDSIHEDLTPGDLGAMNGHDRPHDHARIRQDLDGLVGLPGHRPHGGGKGIAAMPQLPNRVQLQPASILFGVDHEHATGPDHQMINVGAAAGDGQVVQDRPPLPLQRKEQPGGAPLPGRPPPPGDRVRAWAGTAMPSRPPCPPARRLSSPSWAG